MIARFNAAQTCLAILLCIVGALGYWLAHHFLMMGLLRVGPIRAVFSPHVSILSLLLLVAMTGAAIYLWSEGAGRSKGMHIENLVWPPELSAKNDVSLQPWIYIALAVPFTVLHGLRSLQLMVPGEPGLESRLRDLLSEVRQVEDWHSIDLYPGRTREVLLLARMRLVKFDPDDGTLKGI